MKRRFFALVLSLALFIAAAMPPSFAAQGTGCMPTTGTAPSNNAALTGTLLLTLSGTTSPTGGATTPFRTEGIITGLTAGTAYWLDLSGATGSSSLSVSGVSCDAMEF